jgi:bacteriocin-like protein
MNNDRTLSETELDHISGGLNRLNHETAVANGSGHTFGAGIGGNWMWCPHGNNMPVDF